MCPFNTPKKASAQKIRSATNKKRRREKRSEMKTKRQNKKTRRQNAKPKGEGKLGQTTQSATKKFRCCFVLSTLAFQVDKAKQHLNLFVHQHKARQSKGRGSQNLRGNRAKYWTLNVPLQHPTKKTRRQKKRSATG